MNSRRDDTVQQARRAQVNSIPGFSSQVESWVTKNHKAADSQPMRESKTIRDVLTNSDPNDVEKVERCEEPALREISNQNPIVSSRASRVILEAALYYENVGNFQKSIALVGHVVSYANEKKDLVLQRRAHGLLGALYSRLSDFEAAFLHSEIACNLARQARTAEEIIPAFSNSAIILYAAGLVSDAQRISVAISCLPSGTTRQNHVHLINATNGIRLSHQVGDSEAAGYFFARSKSLFNQQEKYITGVSRAYYQAFTAEHLILTGKAGRGIDELEKALERIDVHTNPRVFSLLNCALARGYLAIRNMAQLANCKRRLISLMRLPGLQSYHQEEILTILIDITNHESDNLTSDASILMRQLQVLVVDAKYKNFFVNVAKSYASGKLDAPLERPTHPVPAWVNGMLKEVNGMASTAEENRSAFGNARYAPFGRSVGESKLRSPQYEVAEDWAVAADLLNGGDGQHCFGVGEVVRIMARQLGIDTERSAQMGLAARLHDIGSIATVKRVYQEEFAVPLGEFGTVCLHCEVGERLLSELSQPVLQMATRIASAHHEWWNGSGLPRGLRGENIPLEARLCSVADVYLSLRKPKSGTPWSAALAADQMKSMAGVQLDPSIVSLLMSILGVSDQIFVNDAEIESKRNSLLRAKRALFATLELS